MAGERLDVAREQRQQRQPVAVVDHDLGPDGCGQARRRRVRSGGRRRIADEHGGNRALGTPGYDASVDYVAKALRDKGFDVQTPEFEVRLPFADEPDVTVGRQRRVRQPLNYTIGTPADGVSGRWSPRTSMTRRAARHPTTTACPSKGAVVLVDRGTCPFGDKQAVAAERGAVALIVANNVDGDDIGARRSARTPT